MKTSLQGRLAIIREEAIVLRSYKDSGGVWTIGVGHTAAAGPPNPTAGLELSLTRCLDLFEKDLERYERDVKRAIKVPLKQHEFDALVGFHYNTGAIGAGTVDNLLNAGERAAAITKLRQYCKDNGRTLAGLVRRRATESLMFLEGKYPNVKTVSVYDRYPGKPREVSVSDLDFDKPAEVAAPKSDAVAVGVGTGGALLAQWLGYSAEAIAAGVLIAVFAYAGWRIYRMAKG